MIEFLKHVLGGQNQFASGGLLLMIVGAIGAYLRAIPARLWYWLVDQSTMSITVKDDDAAFHWVKQWFAEQKFVQRVRRVDLDTTIRSDNLALIPAPGRHWFWYHRRPFCVHFSRSEDTRGWAPKRSELLVFQTVGRDKSLLKEFVTEIAACHTSSQIPRRAVASSLLRFQHFLLRFIWIRWKFESDTAVVGRQGSDKFLDGLNQILNLSIVALESRFQLCEL